MQQILRKAPLVVDGKPIYRVYVAGQMTGLVDFGRELFANAADKLRRLGFEVFNPGETEKPIQIT